MNKEGDDLRKFLTEKNDLDHILPDGRWEDYLVAISRIINSDLNTIIKTVRAQKVFRYIYDNEVLPIKDYEEVLQEYSAKDIDYSAASEVLEKHK